MEQKGGWFYWGMQYKCDLFLDINSSRYMIYRLSRGVLCVK